MWTFISVRWNLCNTVKMDKELSLALLLVLLLCHRGSSNWQSFCPYRCQCFTQVQVLCADERMIYLPENISRDVKEVIIVVSSVEFLFANSLHESPQLTKLIFLNNALRSVHAKAFEHLTELQELEISGNLGLNHLHMGTFSKQENLTKLLLNSNRFETILPGMFGSLKQLETLQMKNNIISDLPSFLFLNLTKLRVLDLSQNKLEAVRRETFSGLARLEILKINNNLISNLTSGTFHSISHLTELHLEGNKLEQLSDGIFSALTNVSVLNLRGNLLTAFSDKVFGYEPSNLKELNLKSNRLAELLSLSSLTSLTDLILSANQLSNLTENLFRNVTTLENLDLSENQLTSLPEVIFKDLLSIREILLHNNNLKKVEAKLFEDQALVQRLYLSDNQLEMLPEGFLDSFIFQPTVRLHGNPWTCDCRLGYLHDWVLHNSQGVDMLDRIVCGRPDFLKQRTLVSIDKGQLVCYLSDEKMPDLESCSLQMSNNTLTVKCKVEKCSPMTVRVQFQKENGHIMEHLLKNEADDSQCSNETVIENTDN
ncbi:carboxypeptidase N subunit 2 [Kryptolebias marmoratus]|uniref:Carboxypeptidase N subunit 2-like n=1 Tax=Kryptolebias marmoratus TaxID=37003 RepID=A0A3Q2ZG71_KRYMA|nr:carboxypeptidase N subunit 2 [Kryptolebias marmoratus]